MSQAKSPASSETFCTFTDVVERFLYETLKAMQGEVVQCRAVLDIADANSTDKMLTHTGRHSMRNFSWFS